MDNVTYLPWVTQDEQPTAGSFLPEPSRRESSQCEPSSVGVSVEFSVEAPDFGADVGPDFDADFEAVLDSDFDDAVPADLDAIFDALLRRLGSADLTAGEVLHWCAQRDISADQAHIWLDRLHELGYVDDHRVASFVARKQRERKGSGRAVVARELRRRSIGDDVVAEVIADLDDESELENATAHAIKRAASLSRFDRDTATRRLHGFLSRRGFDGETIREAIRAAFVEHPPRG